MGSRTHDPSAGDERAASETSPSVSKAERERFNWRAAGQVALAIWMLSVAALFFAQFWPDIDTGVDLIRRAFSIP